MTLGIKAAQAAGARLDRACEMVGIDIRTLQRCKAAQGLTRGDRRPEAVRPLPAHALTAQERAQIVEVANEPRFAELPPARIVPMLADEGRYLASESSFHRVLKAQGQIRHRGRAKAPSASRRPTTHIAHGPGEVWCWDVTWLATPVTGRWFYLYLILDLYSRKIVGHEVHEVEAAAHAALAQQRRGLDGAVAAADFLVVAVEQVDRAAPHRCRARCRAGCARRPPRAAAWRARAGSAAPDGRAGCRRPGRFRPGRAAR
jgi:hypothetical protein